MIQIMHIISMRNMVRNLGGRLFTHGAEFHSSFGKSHLKSVVWCINQMEYYKLYCLCLVIKRCLIWSIFQIPVPMYGFETI